MPKLDRDGYWRSMKHMGFELISIDSGGSRWVHKETGKLLPDLDDNIIGRILEAQVSGVTPELVKDIRNAFIHSARILIFGLK